jgi:hypothetical protein
LPIRQVFFPCCSTFALLRIRQCGTAREGPVAGAGQLKNSLQEASEEPLLEFRCGATAFFSRRKKRIDGAAIMGKEIDERE